MKLKLEGVNLEDITFNELSWYWKGYSDVKRNKLDLELLKRFYERLESLD